MKRLPSSPVSRGASDKKMKVSQNEAQTLIELEVCSTMKKNETVLRDLIETVKQLDCAFDYESAIKALEARINIVTQRAEAALACMAKTKTKSLRSSPINMDIRSDSDDESVEAMSHKSNGTKGTNKRGELFEVMETTKEILNKIHDDEKALMAAKDNLKDGAPTVPRPQSPSQCKTMPLYPLPPTTLPSILDKEAASYNIPQKPVVRLALIRNPGSLSVLWNVAENDPSAPPMESYSVLMSIEKSKGSGVFSKWNTIGEVTPIPLPMCVMINKYKPGHKVCVAVVGKDKFGRYGPYSEVATAVIPD